MSSFLLWLSSQPFVPCMCWRPAPCVSPPSALHLCSFWWHKVTRGQQALLRNIIEFLLTMACQHQKYLECVDFISRLLSAADQVNMTLAWLHLVKHYSTKIVPFRLRLFRSSWHFKWACNGTPWKCKCSLFWFEKPFENCSLKGD